MTGVVHRPESAAEVAEVVRGAERVVPRGGGTKPALWSADGADLLDVSALRGITEYLPGEYTVSALAGTPLAEVEARLAAEGQYLPFDPLLVAAGSTVGGAVAAGANGPGRLRYGGLRDFLLAVTFVDGRGETVRGGARVVKNAAGFDLPKLMVGSLGRLGVLTECTFKVFPSPEGCATLRVAGLALDEALEAAARVGAGPVELECLDLVHGAAGWDLELRVGGRSFALDARVQRAADLLGTDVTVLAGEADARHWRARRELTWARGARATGAASPEAARGRSAGASGGSGSASGPVRAAPSEAVRGRRTGVSGGASEFSSSAASAPCGRDGDSAGSGQPRPVHVSAETSAPGFTAGRRTAGHDDVSAETPTRESASVLKLPLTPAAAGALEQILAGLDATGVARVYSAGISQALVAWPAERLADLPALDRALTAARLTALALRAPACAGNRPILGYRVGRELLSRVEQALDPDGRFGRL